MIDSDIRDLIVELVRAAGLSIEVAEVTTATSLTEGGLELSSLELVRLLVNLETRLGIQLDDEEVVNATLATVGDVVALVRGSLVPSHAG